MFLRVLTCSLLAKGAHLKENRLAMCIVQASMKSYLIFIHSLWSLTSLHFYADMYVYTHVHIYEHLDRYLVGVDQIKNKAIKLFMSYTAK